MKLSDSVVLSPAQLHGSIVIPPSKSISHRAILCAAMADGVSRIAPIAPSQDMEATVRCIRALGASAVRDGAALLIDGRGLFAPEHGASAASPAVLDCGESGSTLRFLIPLAAAGGVPAVFTGRGRLPERPIGCFCDCLPPAGTELQTSGGLPLTIHGKLRSGNFSLPGNVSSQFITGLLMALPLLDGDSTITLTTPLESAAYIDLTLDVMRSFGVTAQRTESGWSIPGNQRYRAQDYTVEGDWSQAAFFLGAGLLGSRLSLCGLRRDSAQGDRACEPLFTAMGAVTRWEDNVLQVFSGEKRAAVIDASQIPDLVPVLAACAAFCPGETQILNAARLRIKESDRLQTTAALIRALGGSVRELADGLQITGISSLPGGSCGGANDHRIVMAAAIAALGCTGPVTVSDAHSVKKSFPDFFEQYNRLGGHANVIDMGKSN